MLVIFIHAHIYFIEYSHVQVPDWLIYVYNNFLEYFHPASLLAAISGYLFFKDLGHDHNKWRSFLKDKYRKRILSILIPYVFWVSLFFVMNNLILFLMAKYKAGDFVNHYTEISFSNYIHSFFRPELAVAQHLWYLNNMLFVFVLAPLMLVFNRYKVLFYLAFVLVLSYYYWEFTQNMSQARIIIKYRFILFFMIGAFFGSNKNFLHVFVTNKLGISILGLLGMGAMFWISLYGYYGPLIYAVNSLILPVLVFYLVYLLITRFGAGQDAMYNRSNHFLLYVIHPLLLSVICKILFMSGLLKFTNYFYGLVFIIVLSWLVVKTNSLIYHFLTRYFKSFTHHFL